jgi:hypothetical protein
MVSLNRSRTGSYSARKRIPHDIGDEYKRLFNARHEAKFFLPAGTTAHEAKQRFNEWLAEHEARVAAIRAERDGTGRSLTAREARALAGEWYEWWLSRHAESGEMSCELCRDRVQEAIWRSVNAADVDQFATDEL